MATALEIALAAGLAVAVVHASFARREGRSWTATVRTFVGWLLAFLLAGLLGPVIAAWLLANLF